MKIGLMDVDGHNYPNLALMKLSSYYKSEGEDVSWYTPWEHYDIVFKSKVFTFTPEDSHYINAEYIKKGGTGYGHGPNLGNKIEHVYPDYGLYNVDYAYGFLTRGCPNKCSWCVVPSKEGDISENADITEFWDGQKVAILMDNNILSSPHGLEQIDKMGKLGIHVDFNQGLDARLIANDESIAERLSNLKWHKPLRMACDTKAQIPYIEKAVGLLRKHRITPSNYFIYVLVKDIDDAHERVVAIDKLGCDPFAQPYRDFSINAKPTVEQRRFARWVNHKAIFNSVEYKNYKP